MAEGSGWHWSPWFGIMYGKFPVGIVVVATIFLIIELSGGF